MKQKKTEAEIEKAINRVVATMALSGMALTEDEKEDLRRIERGEISYDDHLKTIIKKAMEIGKKYDHSDAMKLPIEQRRQLMEWIMEDARRAADDAAAVFIQNNPSLSQEDLEDEIIDTRIKAGVARMLELQKLYGFPIPKYDRKSKRAFIEYSDGRKEYTDEIEPQNHPSLMEREIIENNDILIMKVTYDCPICNKIHELQVRERDSALLVKGIPSPYREIYYLCAQGEVEGTNEFMPAWILDLNLARARGSARRGGVLLETSPEDLDMIRKAILQETSDGEIDKIIKRANLL